LLHHQHNRNLQDKVQPQLLKMSQLGSCSHRDRYQFEQAPPGCCNSGLQDKSCKLLHLSDQLLLRESQEGKGNTRRWEFPVDSKSQQDRSLLLLLHPKYLHRNSYRLDKTHKKLFQ
jgi:hypothetical protein